MNEKGYTLIEMLVVVTMLSIISTIVLPNFKKTIEDYKLITAAQQLSQNIKLVQQMSISEGVQYKILFDLRKKDSYQVSKGHLGQQVKLPNGIFLDWTSFANQTLLFSASGAPAQGGTVSIKNNEKKLYIIVSVATGRVRISKTPP